MRGLVAALAGGVIGALAACGTGSETTARAPDSGIFSNTLYETAATAAVAKRGVKVCRPVAVGIGERDWLRGVVEEVSDRRIGVRIVDAGRFPHVLDGVAISVGDIFRDATILWTPCY